jgi:hypothetical protein
MSIVIELIGNTNFKKTYTDIKLYKLPNSFHEDFYLSNQKYNLTQNYIYKYLQEETSIAQSNKDIYPNLHVKTPSFLFSLKNLDQVMLQ